MVIKEVKQKIYSSGKAGEAFLAAAGDQGPVRGGDPTRAWTCAEFETVAESCGAQC